jgi:hypothetical protein
MSKVHDLADQAAKTTAEVAELVAKMRPEPPKTPKPQTRATAKYQANKGVVAKSYKLDAEAAEAFRASCAEAGESQAAVLTRLMAAYVAKDDGPAPCWWCRLMAKLRGAPPA